MDDKLLPVYVVAKRLSVCKLTLYRMIRENRIQAVNINKDGKRPIYRISERRLNDWLENSGRQELNVSGANPPGDNCTAHGCAVAK
jgi:excisionase family DNA binding protein